MAAPEVNLLEVLTEDPGACKIGLLGFAGTGKTWTAVEIALGIRSHFHLEGEIAFFDTETGSAYARPRIERETGKKLLGRRSRSFDELVAMARQCERRGVSVLIVDSITHIWRHLVESYLDEVNAQRAKKGWNLIKSIEFQDWGVIKKKWQEWADFFLNSRLHIVVCGRAGWEYEEEINERTGKKQQVKAGIKMKAESEFGFEPSLVVEMSLEQIITKDGTTEQVNRGTILKDRWDEINGRWQDRPTFEFFRPHIARFNPTSHVSVDAGAATKMNVDERGADEWQREKQRRTVLAEEIEGYLKRAYPSQSGDDKKGRQELLKTCFGTFSWTKISEETKSGALRVGLDNLIKKLVEIGAVHPGDVKGGDIVHGTDDVPADFGAAPQKPEAA